MTILVTGATGNVGSLVLSGLRQRGLPARAAVRDPGRAGHAGDAVAFDFVDSSTWAPAFAGSDAIFLMRPPAITNIKRDIAPALEAAKTAGVRHVVFMSLQGADRIPVVPHARVETWLRDSGMSWTFLRPSFFMQNLSTTHAPAIRDLSEIVVPAGGGRTAFVDVVDVAAVAVEALCDPERHRDRVWTPTGTSADTYEEVARVLSTELGRPIRYTRPGLWRYARHARRTLAMPWGLVAVTAAIYTTARIGLAAGLTPDVQTVTGRPPGTLAAFAHRERAVWVARSGVEKWSRQEPEADK